MFWSRRLWSGYRSLITKDCGRTADQFGKRVFFNHWVVPFSFWKHLGTVANTVSEPFRVPLAHD